jgi:hypothetical protein
MSAVAKVRAILASGKSGDICDDCAKEAGGVPPSEIHISSYHTTTCDVCGLEKMVCSTTDWVWPRQWKRFT